ncbi:MAG: hypothetical protein ACTSQO_09895 [Candidatus Helarchaeota archaeon]
MKDFNLQSLKWTSDSIKKENYSLNAAITKLENALIFILSKNSFKLGLLTISIPSKFQVGDSRISSTTIPLAFGGKDELISKAFGEKISHKTNLPVISIVNIGDYNKEMINDCMELIDRLLENLQ